MLFIARRARRPGRLVGTSSTAASPPLLSSARSPSSIPLGKIAVVAITTSTTPAASPLSLSPNSHRLHRGAPHGSVQANTTPSACSLPFVRRRPLSAETSAVAEGSPIRSPLHAAAGVKLDLSPRGRTRDNLPLPIDSDTGAEVAGISCAVRGATNNAFHNGDAVFGIDSDYSYSDEMAEDYSSGEDYEDWSPEIDEGGPGTSSEDEGVGTVERQAPGSVGSEQAAAMNIGDSSSEMRLSRRIARSGVASRREAERLVKEGAVAVNGATVLTPALSVGPDDVIKVKGRLLETLDKHEPVLWMVHKLRNELVTRHDPEGRPTIFDRLSRVNLPDTLMPVGRLDFNTEGLLLLTNDGDLARKMELPSSGIVRTYSVRVYGNITEEKLGAMRKGCMIEGVRYKGMFVRVEGGGGKGREGRNAWLTIECTEGKNRQIRKICKHLCLKVSRLARIRYGPFTLGKVRPGGVSHIPIPSSFIRRLEEGTAGGGLGSGVNSQKIGGPGPGVSKRRGMKRGDSVGSSSSSGTSRGRGGGREVRIRKGVGAPMYRGDNAFRSSSSNKVQRVR